jgi:hypothetical protein
MSLWQFRPGLPMNALQKSFDWTNVVVERLALLLRTREVPDSNLGPKTGYPEVFRDFLESPQVNSGIVP